MSKARSHAATLGVDVGGTATRIVRLTDGWHLADECVISTRMLGAAGGRPPGQLLVDKLDEMRDASSLKGVGIGVTGPLDADGVIRNRDTLPELSGLPIADTVSEALGVPCVIENDAVTFGLGELRLGAGRGARAILAVTLGTGVGMSAIQDGRPHRGGDRLHPECGHIPVSGGPAPCYCGLESCWEQVAARTVLERFVAEHGGYDDVVAAAAAARGRDDEAGEIFHRYGIGVGRGLTTLVTVFRPRRVVIGGGVVPYFDLFIGATRATMRRTEGYRVPVEIVPSELGIAAGAIGAATLV